MKIRIKGNSLRYRLTRPEVERFAMEGHLEETTDFGANKLTYSLQTTTRDNLYARFENQTITLFMPNHMLREWAGTDRVGFDHNGGGLSLLIEKDFMCLDIAPEEQLDNYPNPMGTC